MFCGVTAPQPPFLISQGTYATFSNCLFHSMHLPTTQLLDVSHFGTVALLDTLFANTTFPQGIVGTDAATLATSPDPLPPDGSTDYDAYGGAAGPAADAPEIAVAAEDLTMWFSPASAEDAAHFGAQFVADDETVSDCRGGRCRGVTLPGCPAAADAAPASSLQSLSAEKVGAGGCAEASLGRRRATASVNAPVDPATGDAVPGMDGVVAGKGQRAVHAACLGAAAGGGGDGVGLGFCAGGRWQHVERGDQLSVEHPRLAALAEVRAPWSC